MTYLSDPLFLAIIGIIALGLYLLRRSKRGSQMSGSMFHKTPTLSVCTTDLTESARNERIDPVVGRTHEVERLAQVLARREKNNALLIGEPGVGKTAIVEGLAQLIAGNEVPEVLRNKRVLVLDMSMLLSGTKYRGELEQRARRLVEELIAAKRSVILFVDEAHMLVRSKGTEGALDFADILKPALARGDIQMIGATTTGEYEKYFKQDLSLDRRFQTIEVKEPTPEETLQILKGVKDKYREFHKVEFTDAALQAAIDATAKLKDKRQPDKALDAIDEAAAMVTVAGLHPAFSKVLGQAAGKVQPRAAELWKRVQELDHESTEGKGKSHKEAGEERERVEEELKSLGVVVIDSADVERVVSEW